MRTISVIAVLFFLTFAGARLAQADSNYLFSQSRVTSELSQVSVEEVFQDSEGYLWFLTLEGVNRFDGKDTTIFRADIANPYAISSNGLTSIAEDSEGNLWFGTDQSGLSRLSKRDYRFKSFKSGDDFSTSPLSNQIQTISPFGDEELLIGYFSGGFSLFHPGLSRFRHYTPRQHPILEGRVITAFFERNDGSVLLGTDGAGVLELDVNNGEIKSLSDRNSSLLSKGVENVLAIHEDQYGDLWIGTSDRGVYMVKGGGADEEYCCLTPVRL